MKQNNLVVLFLILVSVGATLGQDVIQPTQSQNGVNDWSMVETKAKDFSILIPSGYFVRKTENLTTIYYGHRDQTLEITLVSDFKGKKWLKQSQNSYFRKDCEGFSVEKYLVLQCGLKPEKKSDVEKPGIVFVLATDTTYYSVMVNRSQSDPDFYLKVLASIKLTSRQFFKGAGDSPVAINTFAESSLKQDDIVTKALGQPDSTQVKLEKISKDSTASVSVGSPKYSRPIFILLDPDPKTRRFAIDNKFFGEVNLMITYLANGQIGPIKLVSVTGQAYGISNDVFEAAKKIKFIPAEVDGRPVDFTDAYRNGFGVIYGVF